MSLSVFTVLAHRPNAPGVFYKQSDRDPQKMTRELEQYKVL